MKDTVFLILSKSGVSGYRKSKPPLKSGEYAVRVRVSVPDKFFDRVIPTADLEIPEGYMMEPPVEVDLEEPPLPDDERCDETAWNKGVERVCELPEGHDGDHVFRGSAGKFTRPNHQEVPADPLDESGL